jgi:NAD-dependent SIR2 family protein deacetylase
MTHESWEREINRAAEALRQADALIVAAGAGMGVDSGLPDFRGAEGFWRAYPPYARLGLNFAAMANPAWFATDPPFAWGFYGHRMRLYRGTRPHEGFAILRRWEARMARGAFVVTSNIDGHFQRAGFPPEQVAEVHGSIHWMQCTRSCGVGIFPADPFEVEVNEATFLASEPLPACPRCGSMARPNILMFGDFDWDGTRTAEQEYQLNHWMQSLGRARLVIVECGAGHAVPTIRRFSEQTANEMCGSLIRINPREPAVPAGHISLPLGALEALRAIDSRLSD